MNALVYMPRSARPFVRFLVGKREDDAAWLHGVFRFDEAAGETATAEQQASLRQAYKWFNEHVKVPPRSALREPPGTACWFRSDAGEALGKISELAKLLQELGTEIRLIKSDRPGTIVYYDDHQIVTLRPRPGRRRDCYWEATLDGC